MKVRSKFDCPRGILFHSVLPNVYFYTLLQPLPEKFVMKGMVERFNEDFIETRRRALQHFLSKTAEHPLLSQSLQLKVFLTEQVGVSLVVEGHEIMTYGANCYSFCPIL